jgi:hypothetical protein
MSNMIKFNRGAWLNKGENKYKEVKVRQWWDVVLEMVLWIKIKTIFYLKNHINLIKSKLDFQVVWPSGSSTIFLKNIFIYLFSLTIFIIINMTKITIYILVAKDEWHVT